MNSQGSGLVNLDYFTNATAAINSAPSCASLQILANQIMNSVVAQVEGAAMQYAQTALIGSINPSSITNLGTVISAVKMLLSPYAMAYATYTAQFAATAAAVANLESAIYAASNKFSTCSVGFPSLRANLPNLPTATLDGAGLPNSATWGSITGSMTDQPDLSNYLNTVSKVASNAQITADLANSTAITAAANAPLVVTGLPTLPNATYPANKLVYDTTTKRLYRSTGSTWESITVDAPNIIGTLLDAQIAAMAASKLTGTLISSQLGSNIVDQTKMATGLRVPVVVNTLPTLPDAAYPQGSMVTLTTDNKLYRSTGPAWTAAVAAVDLTGQVTTTQITDNSITTAKIVANAITASLIAANTITASQIAADTITAAQIAAGAITSSELAAGAVIAGKIAAGTIVAGDIAANTITASQIAANTITAAQIAANTITASQIAANTITAGQILAGTIGATEIAAGAIYAKHLTVANFDNLIPNANSELASPPANSPEAQGVSSTGARTGTKCRLLAGNSSYPSWDITTLIQCSPGEAFVLQAWGMRTVTGTGGNARVYIAFYAADKTTNTGAAPIEAVTTSYAQYTTSLTAPANTSYVVIRIENDLLPTGTDAYWDDFYFRRMADANLIVDGTLQTVFARIGKAIASTNYVAGTTGSAPVGFCISSSVFTTTFIDGSTDANCLMELGGTANFNGYKAAVVTSRAMTAFNRINNGTFYKRLSPWYFVNGIGTQGISAQTQSAGTGSVVIFASSTTSSGTITKTDDLVQTFNCPPSTQTLTLYWSAGCSGSNAASDGGSASISLYLFNHATGVETLIDSWSQTLTTVISTVTWANRSVNVTSYLSGGGEFSVRATMTSVSNVASVGTNNVTTYLDSVTCSI